MSSTLLTWCNKRLSKPSPLAARTSMGCCIAYISSATMLRFCPVSCSTTMPSCKRWGTSLLTCISTTTCYRDKEGIMQQNALLESYLRQLKLPTFAQNYAAIASDAARTGLSCERYLLALCQSGRALRCPSQAPGAQRAVSVRLELRARRLQDARVRVGPRRLSHPRRAHSHDWESGPRENARRDRIGSSGLPTRQAGALLQRGHPGQ